MENITENPIHEVKIIPNNILLVFPSWESIIGYFSLGNYKNKPVSKINSDPLIFIACAECSFEKNGETLHCVFGLGYYHTKFETDKQGKMIEDNRILTGLVISDFVYDHIATSKPITLQDNASLVLNEKVIRIPFNMKFESEENKTFIKGVLMRNVFVPYKDSILTMLGAIKKDSLYDFSKTGHLLLMATKKHFDEILVSGKMASSNPHSYMDETAGLRTIKVGADEFLEQTLSDKNIELINGKLKKLHEVFSVLDIDEVYLFSLIERGGLILEYELPIESEVVPSSNGLKSCILLSANSRINDIKPWPSEISRNQKLEQDTKKGREKGPLISQDFNPEGYDLGNYKGSVQTAAPQYQISSTTNPKVRLKPLPRVPTGNVEEILKFVNMLVEEDYDMQTMAQGLELCRENLRVFTKSADYIFELSQMILKYAKEPLGLGLSPRQKQKALEKTKFWYEREVKKRLEEERKERERLEAERLERERIEKERLVEERRRQELIEQKRLEKERLEREKKEIERLEAERIEKERIEAQRREEERLEQERKRLEQEKIKAEKLERERIKREGSIEHRLQLGEEEYNQALEDLNAAKNEFKTAKKNAKTLKKKYKKLLKEKKKSEK